MSALTTGQQLHALGTECYAVAIDSTGAEVSERHRVHAWIAFHRSNVQMVCMDDQGGRASVFTATADSRSVTVCVFVDGDPTPAYRVPIHGTVRRGDLIEVDWGPMYDVMA